MKKETPHIPIRVGGIPDGIHEFRIVAVPAEIGLPDEFREEIALHVHMDKTPSQIILNVDISSAAVFPCDRCLEPVRIPYRESFTVLYARDLASARTLAEDDVRIIAPDQPVIDLGDDVRDMALLAVPMRRTCGEDENGTWLCRGEVVRNRLQTDIEEIDPRWERLKELKEKTKDN